MSFIRPGRDALQSFSTTFQTIENPVSVGSKLHGADPNSTVAQVSAAGKCHGTQTGATAPPYNDSQAFLAPGYHNNQEATITVALAGGLDGTNRECEILLRARDDNTQFSTSFGNCTTTGYEINWQHQGAYLICGRFKGSEIDRISSPPAAANGSTLRVQCIDNGSSQPVFRVWINGVAQTWTGTGTTTLTDTAGSPPQGSPGIGFWKDSAAANNEFWITRFDAMEV